MKTLRSDSDYVARAVLVLVLALVGCGGKEEKRPSVSRPTSSHSAPASSASQTPPPVLPKVFGTLVVDWRPEHRADIEATMRRGLCLLQVGPQGIVPVKECKGPGAYAFTLTTRSERQLLLGTAEEIKLTLPSYGAGLAAKLEPDLKNGAALAIALITIGNLQVSWNRLTRAELTGDCRLATHFVRGASVGAFAVRVGTKGRYQPMAEAMNTPSSPGHTLLQRAGSFEACQSAPSPGVAISASPPDGCNAILGIELQQLD
jgi:hypothetical protein